MALKMQMTPKMATRASVEQASLKTKRRFANRGCKLVGCGSAVPELQISNADLSKIVETSDEWIATRTGIRRRRILSGNESLKDLAVEAARNALEMAQVHPDEIDLVMLCTSTAEDQFGIAAQVQHALGCSNYPLSFDIRAGCSGFAIGLESACSYVRGGDFRNVLLIGAEAVSRILDWTDRGTCILFGDAAGAVVLQACGVDEDGLYAFDSHTDSEGGRHITTSITHDQTTSVSKALRSFAPGFPPGNPSHSYIQMNGKEVFRFAVQWVPQSLETALKKAGLRKPDIDWLLLHQANQRIMDAVATRLEVPPERIISNIADYGNTSSASIPLALDEAARSGKIKVGDVIATSGFGAGLTCASAIVRWG